MADPRKGIGRGHALLQALQKRQMVDSSPSPTEGSPESTPTASQAPSTLSGGVSTSGTSIGGRGKLAMMMSKMQQKPGGPTFSPASDVSPAAPPPPGKGLGRGMKLFQSLQSKAAPKPAASVAPSEPSEVSAITDKMSQTTVTSTALTGKNKYFREVKETAPVVKIGEAGTPCEVTANFIKLNFEENNVFEYEVKYEPDQDYKGLRFKLLNEHRDMFKEKAFDGTTLYLPHSLPNPITELISTNEYDNSKVKVMIIFRRTRRLSEMIHIYNVLFNNIMKDLKLVRFGRQYFNEHAAIQIPQHKLEVWPGYVTAVDEYQGGLMLTLDSTHRVLRTQSVLSLIQETVQRERARWKQAATEILSGCSVMTTYNKKLFRVDLIDDSMTPRSTFQKNEGGEKVSISYVEYYKKNYGIDIMDLDQPMLISKESKRMPGTEEPTEFMICLVPELCQMTGLTDEQRSNFGLMKDVATYTRITPNQRHAAFKQYIKNVMSNESAKKRLAGWGLSIAPETIDMTARTLPPEPLFFGNGVKLPGKTKADWNMDATNNAVMEAVDLLRWVVLYTQRDQNVANDFVDILMRSSRPMGIVVSKPDMRLLPNDRSESYVKGVAAALASITSLQMVVCVCPTSRDDRYAAIKKACCAYNPVPSQVINARTLMNQKKIRSITQKILLQINCKLGGTLWSIAIPVKTAMIIGIDAYHDATRKHSSVCGFVSSYNPSMTHWYSKVVFQERGQEIVDKLKVCLIDALKHYLRVNGRLPDRIIIYRDGVGDGQLKLLQSYEIPQMQVCLKEMDALYKPKLTYVVVQKRINSRVFLKTGSGYDNPMPGTVVDHAITRRDWYDFLIVSQKVNQGTVTPTHYVVIHDDSEMSPDQCQRITYKLCHLYYNWPGTVRVPAPCQYAHKLAYLTGQFVHTEPANVLSDKLFFL